MRDVNASGCNRDESGLCIAHDIPPMRDGNLPAIVIVMNRDGASPMTSRRHKAP